MSEFHPDQLRDAVEAVEAKGYRPTERYAHPDVKALAYRGMPGCTDPTCLRDMRSGQCWGWHCATCHASTSYQGHVCPGGAS